ncbi:MAG: general secretion pathway protein GspJ [Hyphomicrobiales bacterium]|nr:general secretion pathway protein GspJ [Hyphomicrobiales bacterium]
MRREQSETGVAGFSLVEATAAVALTATIVLALSAVAGQWLPNWRAGFVDLQRADLLGLGLERVVADLSAAEYVSAGGGAGPLFEGDVSSVTFVRPAIGPNSYPHLEVVRLAEVIDNRGVALTRTRADFAPMAPGRLRPLSFSDPVALVRAPFRASFAYAGPDRVWVQVWRGQNRLPDAVRITVRDVVANRILAASTAVRIKVTAPGAPKLEANATDAQPSAATAPQQTTPQQTAPAQAQP